MNLIRILCALAMIVSVMPLFVDAERFIAAIDLDYDQINDEISLNQLRELLLGAYDLDLEHDALVFRFGGRGFSLSKVNDKLLLQPGTQIYLDGIDDLHFEIRNGCIYVCYRKGNRSYEKALSKAQGIDIDSFSDCVVSDDGSDSAEE